MGEFQGFSKDTIAFLKDLERNNTTTWFHANKERYEKSVKAPSQAFLGALINGVGKVLPEVKDGKVMRINRDIRFSKDKLPYKTHLALMLWDGTMKGMGCAHLYFRLDAKTLVLGDGVHEFDDKHLASFRKALTASKSGGEFSKILKGMGKYDIGGKFYKKIPKGFDASHPNAEYLTYKGFYVGAEMPLPKQAFGPGLVEFCVNYYKAFAPLHRWMCAI